MLHDYCTLLYDIVHNIMQEVVVRNDSACGSTIGPMVSAKLGLRTVDLGMPQLSMHSIREMCCTSSVHQATALYKVSSIMEALVSMMTSS